MITIRPAKALAAVLLSTSVIAPASAASVIYTLDGTFFGTFPTSVVTAARFTGMGDTDKAYLDNYGGTVVPLTSLTAVADGVSYKFTTPVDFFVNANNSFGGLAKFDGQELSTSLVRFFGSTPGGLKGPDGTSTVAPTSALFVTDSYTRSFETDRGRLNVFFARDLVFSSAVSAVPEPGTWTMMLVGFGFVGALMRRRNSVRTTFLSPER